MSDLCRSLASANRNTPLIKALMNKKLSALTLTHHLDKEPASSHPPAIPTDDHEAVLGSLLRDSPLGIGFASDGVFRQVNPEFARIFGFPAPEEMTGVSALDLVDPIDRPHIAERIKSRSRGERLPSEVRIRGVRRDGTRFPLEARVVDIPFRNEITTVCYVMDIGERVRMDEALRVILEQTAHHTRKAFFRSLVESLASVLHVRCAFITQAVDFPVTAVRTIAFWSNGQWHRKFDYSLLESAPCREVMVNGSSFHASGVQALLPIAGAFSHIPRVSYLGIRFADSTGRVSGHLAVIDDKPMSDDPQRLMLLKLFAARVGAEMERLRMDGALRESEERYRLLIENSLDLVAEISADLKFVYVNPNFGTHLGYKPLELVGKEVLTHIHHKDIPNVLDKLTMQEATGRYQYRDKGGKWRWLESSARSYWTSSGERRWVVFSRDVTDRRLAEEQLERSGKQLQKLSEKLERVIDEERRRLSREIHDELGQILTILKLDLSLLKSEVVKIMPEETPKLESSIELVDTAVAIVKRIATELRPQLDALGLCAAVRWDLRHFERKTGIRTSVSIQPDEFTLHFDRSTALYKILHEALTNVVRHANATEVAVKLERTGNLIRLLIKDNGRGISRKMAANTSSLGFIGMRERVRPFRGEVSIKGNKRTGTTVTATVYLD